MIFIITIIVIVVCRDNDNTNSPRTLVNLLRIHPGVPDEEEKWGESLNEKSSMQII